MVCSSGKRKFPEEPVKVTVGIDAVSMARLDKRIQVHTRVRTADSASEQSAVSFKEAFPLPLLSLLVRYIEGSLRRRTDDGRQGPSWSGKYGAVGGYTGEFLERWLLQQASGGRPNGRLGQTLENLAVRYQSSA